MQYSTAASTTPPTTHRARRVTGAFAVVLGVVLTAVGLSAGPSLAFTGPVATPSTAASNDASYWGAGCTKLDESGEKSWTADASYSIVVLKAGTTDYAFSDVVAGDVLTIPQEISHFIFCPPTSTTTTTTTVVEAETTTTTAPPEEATTTTVVETVAPTTTSTPVVGQAGPTTTLAASAGATVAPEDVELPQTGTDTTTSLAVIGGLLMAAGMTMLSLARRRTIA